MEDDDPRCRVTGNLCGSDTWAADYICGCVCCQIYVDMCERRAKAAKALGLSEPLLGTVLSPHYGAVALWVGRPGLRLMGFSVVWVDQRSAALDEMVRLDQEMGLR